MQQTLHLVHVVAAFTLFATLVVRSILLKMMMNDKAGERLALVRVVRILGPVMGSCAGVLLLLGIALTITSEFSFAAPWLLTKEFITLLIFLLTFMLSSPATRQLASDVSGLPEGETLPDDLRDLAHALYQLTLFVALMVVLNMIVAYNKF